MSLAQNRGFSSFYDKILAFIFIWGRIGGMKNIKLPELLAPAGTLDAFKTAILYGADAISIFLYRVL